MPVAPSRIVLPSVEVGPGTRVMRRLGVALLLLLIVGVLVWLGKDGYKDSSGRPMDLLSCVYYATVTMSTIGYGDIVPVSDTARLVNIILITPARILFIMILVGTTLAVLAESAREEFRRNRWEKHVREHYVVVGYGTKGRSAVESLRDSGVPKDQIVVVDTNRAMGHEAAHEGLVTVIGDATRSGVLRKAHVQAAKEVIVAVGRDDAAVLTVLTARELNGRAGIQVAVREAENAPLLRQSGADHVVTSSEAAGRLLGVAANEPHISEVMEDLIVDGGRLDLVERPVRPQEIGHPIHEAADPALALVRDGSLRPYSDPSCRELRSGDRLVVVVTDPDGKPLGGDLCPDDQESGGRESDDR
ncbi:potassium channel family protein [Actinocorallia lasiicapitis]